MSVSDTNRDPDGRVIRARRVLPGEANLFYAHRPDGRHGAERLPESDRASRDRQF